ncbi:MAG: 2-oxoglutarate dehydrogenase E1 component, partial [Bacteroidia bacterium]
GDVKYHMGYSSTREIDGNKIDLSLAFNPSHLEAVNVVVAGRVRASQDLLNDESRTKALALLIHGDAAFAGQGSVAESLVMNGTAGYDTGGVIHIIINNQIGFTANPSDSRSTTYASDLAKSIDAPIFHVNGDDVEAVVKISGIISKYRQTFKKDAVLDVICYRKYGHNEGDEPRFTQPLLYKAISTHPNPKEIYQNRLISNNDFTKEALHAIEKKYKTVLESELDIARKRETLKVNSYLQGAWSGIRMAKAEDFYNSPQSGITDDVFLNLANRITTLPPNTTFFNKIQRLYQDRKTMITQNSYDWAMGELMAYASLLHEGHTVRFSGQDVERGTFSHRHAVVKIEDSEDEYEPLAQVSAHAKLEIYNSLLSEYGVLGFEYGYAFAAPNTLTIWEAQFGDFFNGAQIIIDQYLSSSEYKWRRMNGLVVLLPHGYEGQGPEHSSARMERFLQMCAEDNMQIVNATTPAQQFHVLRRQLKWPFRKPLICFTPKKLLRFPECVSTRADFTSTTNFQEVLNDPAVTTPEAVHTVVLCSGKVYYDLAAYKRDHQLAAFAIIRLEQLYPFPYTQLERILKLYTKATTFLYVQEEPENMGSWRFAEHHLRKLSKHLVLQSGALLLWNYCGRKESASPATGFSKRHQAEHDELLKQVFVSAQTPSPLNV